MKWLRPEERTKIEQWLDLEMVGRRGRHGPLYRLFVAIALESGLRLTEIIGDEDHKGLVHAQANLQAGEWEQVKRLKRHNFRSNAPLGRHTERIYREMFHADERFPNKEIFRSEGPQSSDCLKFCYWLGNQLGITKLTPHRFRHTLGKDMADAGAKPSEIQKILGHATASMSVTYTEATDKDAMRAAKRVRE